MRRIAACAIALVSAGCGQLFGIEHIPLAGSDGAVTDVGGDVSVPPGMFQLDVTTFGGALGTVTIDDGDGAPAPCTAISPDKCSAQYPAGTPITLTPTADPTSVFLNWQDACLYQNVNDTGGGTSCMLTPTSGDILVTARFVMTGQAWLALIPDQGSVDDMGSNITCATCIPNTPCTAGEVCVSVLANAEPSSITAHADPGCTAFDTFRFGTAGCADGAPSCAFTPSPAPSATVINYNFVTTGSNCSQ